MLAVLCISIEFQPQPFSTNVILTIARFIIADIATFSPGHICHRCWPEALRDDSAGQGLGFALLGGAKFHVAGFDSLVLLGQEGALKSINLK